MKEEMTHWERLRAAIRGEETDRTPISLWRHWATQEETTLALVYSTVRWQREYDWDMIKVTPRGTYGVEDWGAVRQYVPNAGGVQTVGKTAISAPTDYARLAQLDVEQGCLGEQLDAMRLIAEELGDSAPYVMTVFSPLTLAIKLAGNRVLADLRRDPELVKEGLQTITDTMIDFCRASLAAGADGIFYATQAASYRLLNAAEHREFGGHFDRQLLAAIRPEAEFLILHDHGEDTMFDTLTQYPVDAINWHDRLVGPSLGEARNRYGGMVVGGVHEWKTLLTGTPAEVEAEIHEAIDQVNGRGLMIGPGCVVPTTTPPANLLAARQAVLR
jgi:uroporphyrinogen decarboxylase